MTNGNLASAFLRPFLHPSPPAATTAALVSHVPREKECVPMTKGGINVFTISVYHSFGIPHEFVPISIKVSRTLPAKTPFYQCFQAWMRLTGSRSFERQYLSFFVRAPSYPNAVGPSIAREQGAALAVAPPNLRPGGEAPPPRTRRRIHEEIIKEAVRLSWNSELRR